MVGNIWGIVVTGGLAFASFYAVLVFINKNFDTNYMQIGGEIVKVKSISKIDPSFLLDADG